MLIQEVLTDLAPEAVVRQAKEFFTTRFNPYAAQVSEEGDSHLKLVVEAGEVLIGAVRQGERTLVRASASRPHHEVSQFLATLAPPEEVRQNVRGPGASGAG